MRRNLIGKLLDLAVAVCGGACVPCRPVRPTATRMQRFASNILGADVRDWVGDRRRNGATWSRIAEELHTVTEGAVDIGPETLRLWFNKDTAVEV